MSLKGFLCYCGGIEAAVPGEGHVVGEGNCYREVVPIGERPVKVGDNAWLVNGHTITDTTLFQQRLYAFEHDVWTRPKDHESTISLPEET